MKNRGTWMHSLLVLLMTVCVVACGDDGESGDGGEDFQESLFEGNLDLAGPNMGMLAPATTTPSGVPIDGAGASNESESTEDAEGSDNERPGSGNGPGQGLSCNEIFGCFADCPSGDRDCIDGCLAEGAVTSQSLVQDIGQCIRENSCEDDACVEENCQNQIRACNADDAASTESSPAPAAPGGGVAGGLSCNEVYGCSSECPSGDQDCYGECFQQGTPSGQATVNAMGECIQSNGCEDNACVENNCQAQIVACDADGEGEGTVENNSPSAQDPGGAAPVGQGAQGGGLACNDVFGCYGQCMAGDRACLDQCRAQASAQTQGLVDAIGECVRANQCQDDPCVIQNSPAEIAACDADETGPAASQGSAPAPQTSTSTRQGPTPNSLECQDVFGCFGDCPENDQVCLDDCYGGGTVEAQTEVDAVGDCIREQQCQDPDCVNARCEVEVAACEDRSLDDGLEPSGEGDDENLWAQASNSMVHEGLDDAAETEEEPGGDQDDALGGGGLDQPFNGHAHAAGTCADPNTLTAGHHEGTTAGAESVHRGDCAGGGQEQVYRLEPGGTGTLCIDTEGSALDTVLYVRLAHCGDTGAELSCNDDASGPFSGTYSAIELEVQAGETYFVFVDSYNAAGSYILGVREGPCQ